MLQNKPLRYLLCGLLVIVLVMLGKRLFEYAVAGDRFMELAADIDHRMKPDPALNINSDGIRSRHEADYYEEDDFNIIFLGDSYVYGFLLNDIQAPPAQLELILREKFDTEHINVINFGWTSSSPALSLRLLQDIGRKYKPDLVLLAVDMSDYRDDYFYRRFIAADGFYKYAHQYPRITGYLLQVLKDLGWDSLHRTLFGYTAAGGYFVARQPLEESRYLFDTVYDSMNSINAYAQKELGVPFIAFIPARHWQYTDRESPATWEVGSFDALGPYALENFRYFAEKRQGSAFPIVPLLDEFRKTDRFPLCFDKDSHWNKHGARFFAELVFEKCLDLGCFPELAATNKAP